MPESPTKVRIRMYRPGLGDCFLLTFSNNGEDSHVLIDCGIFSGTSGEKKRMVAIAKDIEKATGGRLNAVVATHEHWDHVAGFYYAKEVFNRIEMDEVWVAWTEDPEQEVARERRKLRLHLEQALHAAVRQLTGSTAIEDQERGRAIADVMAFSGPSAGVAGAAAFAKRSNEAMEYVAGRKKTSTPYLKPGNLLRKPWLPGVRVYVLGPPEQLEFIKDLKGERETDLYGAALGAVGGWLSGVVSASASAVGFDDAEMEAAVRLEPFDRVHRWTEEELIAEGLLEREAMISYRSEDWRRIDSDWYNTTARIALQLDSMTNNTSLVLAFELVQSGRVLLFVGDAQIGNWRSWHELSWEVPDGQDGTRKVTAKDLLKHTVFYKVGHHGSHNATRKEGGLELMTSPELVAAIPTDEEFSRDKKHWEMPAHKLEEALLDKTRGRLLRADRHQPPDNTEGLTAESWESFVERVTNEALYVDYVIEG